MTIVLTLENFYTETACGAGAINLLLLYYYVLLDYYVTTSLLLCLPGDCMWAGVMELPSSPASANVIGCNKFSQVSASKVVGKIGPSSKVAVKQW
jgi:hypothetical protein